MVVFLFCRVCAGGSVAVLNVALCVVCSSFMVVEDARGDDMDDAYVELFFLLCFIASWT